MAARRRAPPGGTLEDRVAALCQLLREGQSLLAIERYYAPHVSVFENRALARAGRDECLRHEQKMLAGLEGPPRFRFGRVAVNERDEVAFLECVVRFTERGGRPLRLEQVAVQTWERGLIVEERFYYEGLVDEGD